MGLSVAVRKTYEMLLPCPPRKSHQTTHPLEPHTLLMGQPVLPMLVVAIMHASTALIKAMACATAQRRQALDTAKYTDDFCIRGLQQQLHNSESTC